MSLLDTINNDYLEAYKNRQENIISTLRLLKSALQNTRIAQKTELTDDDIIGVVRHEIKQREESLIEYKRGQRSDLVNQTKVEIEVLTKYLPPQLSDKEIIKVIKETLQTAGNVNPQQPGKLIGLVLSKTKSQADSARVIKLIQKTLGQKR